MKIRIFYKDKEGNVEYYDHANIVHIVPDVKNDILTLMKPTHNIDYKLECVVSISEAINYEE